MRNTCLYLMRGISTSSIQKTSTNERPVTDHVISGQMNGLKKNCMGRGQDTTHGQTLRLYDWQVKNPAYWQHLVLSNNVRFKRTHTIPWVQVFTMSQSLYDDYKSTPWLEVYTMRCTCLYHEYKSIALVQVVQWVIVCTMRLRAPKGPRLAKSSRNCKNRNRIPSPVTVCEHITRKWPCLAKTG